ncbi:glycine betaine ABC transporter substrate-binding protein [Anaerobacillus sp. MEB173]|uniref:glycine betaine ABC transporter substrate-binding protein n=1 Tax=Anaerobacillus sp. MEB173 TaxID=3383345 RepID=UPI003F934AF2
MKKTAIFILLMLFLSFAIVGCSGTENTNSKEEDTEKSVGDLVNYTITGIEPGSGMMGVTQTAIEEYGLDKWILFESSEAAMLASLNSAYKNQEPIIITGWVPHWMFSEWDLKFLEDPKQIFGPEEQTHTIVRQGLRNDHPSAYDLMDRFYWNPDNLADVMQSIEHGNEPKLAGEEWVKNHSELVKEWTEGIPTVNGEEVSIVHNSWADVIAGSNVAAALLETIGYDVKLIQVEAAPLWAGLAKGDVDIFVGAWLPTNHMAYYEEYKEKIEDLGANLDGTRIGLVVPEYMDLNSIEDLK